jgi:hypothetical protein
MLREELDLFEGILVEFVDALCWRRRRLSLGRRGS